MTNRLERYAAARNMTPKQALKKLFAGGRKLEAVAAELHMSYSCLWLYVRRYGHNWQRYKSFVYNGKRQTMVAHCRDLGISHSAVIQMGLRRGLKQARLLTAFMQNRPAIVTQHAIDMINGLTAVHGKTAVARVGGVSYDMMRDMCAGRLKTVRRVYAKRFADNLDINLEHTPCQNSTTS